MDVLIPVAAVLVTVAVAICLHMLNRVRDDLADPKTRRDELHKLRSPGFVATYRGWLAAVLDRLDVWFGERLFFHWRGVSICAGIAMFYAFVFFIAGWGFGGPGGLGLGGSMFMGKIADPAARGGIAGALAGGVSGPVFLASVLFLLLLPITNGFLDYLSLSVSRRLGRHLLGKATIRIRTILGHTAIDLAAAAVLLAALAFVVPWAIQSFNLIVGPSEGGEPLPLKPLLARVSADDATLGDRLWVGGMLFSTLVPTAAHLAMLWTGLFALGSGWRRRTIEILQKPANPDPGCASAAELTVAARYLVLRWAEGALAAVATIMALVAFYGLAGSMAEHLAWVAERGIAFAGMPFD